MAYAWQTMRFYSPAHCLIKFYCLASFSLSLIIWAGHTHSAWWWSIRVSIRECICMKRHYFDAANNGAKIQISVTPLHFLPLPIACRRIEWNNASSWHCFSSQRVASRRAYAGRGAVADGRERMHLPKRQILMMLRVVWNTINAYTLSSTRLFAFSAGVDFNETQLERDRRGPARGRTRWRGATNFFNHFSKLGVFIIFDCRHAPERSSLAKAYISLLFLVQIDSACVNFCFLLHVFSLCVCFLHSSFSPFAHFIKCFVYCLMTHFWKGPVTIGLLSVRVLLSRSQARAEKLQKKLVWKAKQTHSNFGPMKYEWKWVWVCVCCLRLDPMRGLILGLGHSLSCLDILYCLAPFGWENRTYNTFQFFPDSFCLLFFQPLQMEQSQCARGGR